MEIVVNPLVNWVWVGFGILALGTGIALLPDTAFAFALAKVPANAVDARRCCCWRSCCGRRRSSRRAAQTVAGRRERSALERRLEGEIMCTCGLPAADGQLPDAAQLRHYDAQAAKLNGVISPKARTTTQSCAAFVQRLRQPGRAGRAASTEASTGWRGCFPYLVAAAGARRHRRHRAPLVAPAAPAAAGDAGLDPALDARLDDELRNLD